MKLHLSVDDVIHSLIDINEKRPESVFDIPFFKFFLSMNVKYGALLTFYAYGNYGKSFYVDTIQKKYWKELSDCNFIRFGFHGMFFREDNIFFESDCNRLYSCLDDSLRASIIRLHRYEADDSMINTLRNYGATTFLCREEESRKISYFPPSYFLNEDEEKMISTIPVNIKGIKFVKTSIGIELHEKKSLINDIENIVESSSAESIIAVYVHEKFLNQYTDVFEHICKMVNNSDKIEFTF